MIEGQLSYAIWLSLPLEIRTKLVTLFGIPRSGSTVVDYRVSGAVVTSDGYTAPDLQAISLRKMQHILDTDDANYYKLFEEVITHIDALLGGTFEAPVSSQEPTPPPPEKRVYTPAEEAVLRRFCDSCDSKGGRHKKVCPKYA